MCFARQRDFPTDIVSFAPANWRICIGRDAVSKSPPPLLPTIRRRGAGGNTRRINRDSRRGGANKEKDETQRRCHADLISTFHMPLRNSKPRGSRHEAMPSTVKAGAPTFSRVAIRYHIAKAKSNELDINEPKCPRTKNIRAV